MSQGFDDSYQPANPFPNVLTPWRDDAAAQAVHHPFPEWKPEARGDARALLPYVDHDIGESEKTNPVGEGLTWADRAHLGVETVANGGKTAAKVAEEASEFMAGGAEGAEAVLGGISAFAAPLALGAGAFDLVEGIDLVRHGDTTEGSVKLMEGGAGITSGGAGIATFAGSAGAASFAAGGGAAAVGVALGHYGDKQVEKLDWLHDDNGKAISASESAANYGQKVDDYLTLHGHPMLGTAAGIATTFGASVPAAGVAAAAIPVGAGHWLGTTAANHKRTSHYENYDVNIVGGAKSLANYDDDQAAAVERSKREHPEKWGRRVNPDKDGDGLFTAMKKEGAK